MKELTKANEPKRKDWLLESLFSAMQDSKDAMVVLKKYEAICKESGDKRALAFCYWSWGALARERGDSTSARFSS